MALAERYLPPTSATVRQGALSMATGLPPGEALSRLTLADLEDADALVARMQAKLDHAGAGTLSDVIGALSRAQAHRRRILAELVAIERGAKVRQTRAVAPAKSGKPATSDGIDTAAELRRATAQARKVGGASP